MVLRPFVDRSQVREHIPTKVKTEEPGEKDAAQSTSVRLRASHHLIRAMSWPSQRGAGQPEESQGQELHRD